MAVTFHLISTFAVIYLKITSPDLVQDLRNMLNSNTEWTISFAGCGFLSVYYFGVYSCLLERARDLTDRTTKICGASSAALIGAMIACRISPAKCCENLMELAREARKGLLGSMHPSFNLLKLTRDLLVRELPSDAHLLASGRLCVSLTRVSDGQNVLVSEFSSKNDLIQRYVDGALSNNLPYFCQRNTITVSPFSGESDICPYDNPFYFQEIRHSNVSIQVNFTNVHRVIQAFFPPEPEVMAEICHSGYKDALMFLQAHDFLQDPPMTDLIIAHKWSSFNQYRGHNKSTVDINNDNKSTSIHSRSMKRQNWQLEKLEPSLLPEPIQKVFCDASTKNHGWMEELLVVKLVTSILMLFLLPVEMIYFMFLRAADWMPDVMSDLLWLWKVTVQITGLLWRRLCSKEKHT